MLHVTFPPVAAIKLKNIADPDLAVHQWAMAEWLDPPLRTLDELAAYDAMRAFLEAYWDRGGRTSEDVAVLLSFLSRDVWASEMPSDPAMWQDWREAVDKVSRSER